MEKKERLKKAIDYLRLHGMVEKDKDVALRMKADPSNVSRALKDVPTDRFLRRFNEAFGNKFNTSWLLTGEGSMLSEGAAMPSSKVDVSSGISAIPMLPVSAQAGSLNEFVTSIKLHDCEMVVSPAKGADFALPVTGDSMAPEYPNGSQVHVKKINERAFIEWGKVYVLDTVNGTVIKRIVPSDREGYVRCLSINPAPIYAPFEVALSDIYGIYRVLLCLSIK